jgi:hypothetical protein
MVALNLSNSHSKFNIICADGEGVLISFSLGNNGLALVASFRLSFLLNEDFMYIDEDVFDALSRVLIHTIG